MQARAVDLVRIAPQPNARPSADAAAGPTPRTRFQDELSRRTRANSEPAKADTPKREPAKAAKPRRDADVNPADNAAPAKPADAEAADPEDIAAACDESPAKAEKSKTKSTKKSDAKKTDGEDVEAPEDAAVADATPPVALPMTEAIDGEGDDLVIDADATGDQSNNGDADADAAVDPDAIAAAQLVAQQAATPAVPTKSPVDVVESADPATVTTAVKGTTPAASAITDAAADAEAADAAPHRPHAAKATDAGNSDLDATADAEAAGAFQLPPDAEKVGPSSPHAKDDLAALPVAVQPTGSHDKPSALTPLAATPQPTPMRDPAEHNIDKIVTSVRGELLTKGGTMDIRLDPPTLGQVQLQITVEDGVLSANIQTTNDEATRLLSHNLAQLKNQLESAGVSVDRIQVKQATPAEQSNPSNQGNAEGDPRQQSANQDQSARQEQQRREALQRMWARVAGNGDPLDLVA